MTELHTKTHNLLNKIEINADFHLNIEYTK